MLYFSQGRHGLIAFALTALLVASSWAAAPGIQETGDRKDAQESKTAGSPGAVDDNALDGFLQIYRLADGQNLKRIEPPDLIPASRRRA
jgi:hypothetical protein